jgi:hypothetical protein
LDLLGSLIFGFIKFFKYLNLHIEKERKMAKKVTSFQNKSNKEIEENLLIGRAINEVCKLVLSKEIYYLDELGIILKEKETDFENLLKLAKIYPSSYISMIAGMPILTVVYIEPNTKSVSKKRGTKNASNRNI